MATTTQCPYSLNKAKEVKTNDTTIENIALFVSFYLAMVYGATITGIDANVITSAFLTKTVFSLVDERIKRPNDNKK